MSKQYPGGLITKSPVTPSGPYETSTAAGIWTLNQAAYWTKQGLWPTAGNIETDPYFEYVTMLLHGNGSASGTTNVLPFNSDASTNVFNLAINGDARSNNFNPYQAGYYSNYFDGSGDYLSVANATALQLSGSQFTIEGWFYLTVGSTDNNEIVCQSSGSADANVNFQVRVTSGNKLRFLVMSGASPTYIDSTATIATNSWYHFACVCDGSGAGAFLRMWVNGAYQTASSSFNAAGINTNTAATQIGAWTFSSQYLTGYISNFRILKGTALYTGTSNITVPTEPLTAITNTSLLTCQSNRFIDNSTNAFAITANGNTAVAPAQPFTLPSSVATYGSGYFDGTGDNLTTSSNTAFAFGTGDFTIEFWAYKTANTPGNYDIAFGTGDIGTGNNGYFVELSSTRGFLFAANNAVVLSYAMNPNTSAWNHYAITRSGSTLRLFVGGAVVASTTYSTSLPSNTAVRVGGSGNDFFGYLSDMRVVKGTAVYTTTYTLPTAPLTAISGTSLLTTQYNGAGNNNGFKDSSQNNFVVSRFGNTTQGTFTPFGSNWSNYIDVKTSRIEIVNSNSSMIAQGTEFTLESWVFLTVAGTGNSYNNGVPILCSSANSSSTSNGKLFMFGSTTFGFWDRTSSVWLTINYTATLNQWFHFAIVYTGTTYTLYINGTSVGTTSDSGSYYSDSTWNFYLGTTSGAANGTYIGPYVYLSNLRYTKSQVYTSNFTPSTTPLTAIANTTVLTCQSNRFKDNSTNSYAVNTLGSPLPSVQRFSPFAPTSAYSTSTIGGSGYFDGTGDYLTGTSPNLSGTWTVELWWYPTALSGNQTIISFNNGAGPGINIWSNSSGQLSVDNGSTGQSAFTTTTFKLNQWNHLAVVRNSTTTTGYINGVVAGSNSFSPLTTSAFSIGRFNGGTFQYANGYISNVRVVNGTAVYTSSFTPPTAPVVATSGTSLLCDMTNAAIYDNSMMNDLETVGNAMVSTSVKKYGAGSMYFDGTTDYLKAANTLISNFGSGSFTVEAWVYFNSVSGTQVIAGNYQSSTVGWSFGKSGSTGYFYASFSGDGNDINGTTTVAINTWYHVAVSGKPGATGLKLFVNGVQEGSTYTGAVSLDATTPLYISDLSGLGYGINGYIDDLRVTKGIARYTANFTPPTSQFLDQ